MQLDSLYQELILDHYKNPKNKVLLPNYDAKVHHVNPSCGDEQDFTIITDGNVIKAIGWDGVGCSISQASTSILSELLIDKKIEEAMKICNTFIEMIQSKGKIAGDENILDDAIALSGVSKFPARVKCALLGWMAFKDSLSQALTKEGKENG
jgi:nitrogen fixation protein NifU and related proteins